MEYAIEAENLSKIYQNKVALYNFSLKIKKGQIFGLLGPNGAGKSTFIRMIAGLEKIDSGTLKICGEPPNKKNRRQIGIAPQENAIYPLLSCMENLFYFGSLYGVGGKKARARAVYLLENLGLSDKKDVPSEFLSGGMKRRLSLACALMHEPDILFLDEPTSGVDPVARREFWRRINTLAEQRVTVLVTTHFMEEAEYCDRLAIMIAGEILTIGSPAEIKERARTREQAEPTMEDAFISLIEAREKNDSKG